MAQSATFLVTMNMFFNILSLSCLPCSRSNGFNLKLVHRDSPLSPLYQTNLSNLERFMKNVEISESRASYFQLLDEIAIENSRTYHNNTIRLPLRYYEPSFTVQLELGTPSVQRTFAFDIGSNLTWTQCEPCVKCFKQDQPLFNMKESSSFMQMSTKHKLAKEFICDSSMCYYRLKYYSGQSSTGVASVENFTFKTAATAEHRVERMVFGCGIMNSGSFRTSAITGVLGMNKDPISFARQLGGRIKSRFSYCIPTINSNTKESYLRFGEEAYMRTKNYKSLPFLRFKKSYLFFGKEKESHYRLNLTGISIAGERLRLKNGAFSKGCVIDSGSSISHMEKKAYSVLEKSIQKYFSKFKSLEKFYLSRELHDFLCYSRSGPFTGFPSMTYHFKGADLHVPPENLFLVERTFFCLEIRSSSLTLLGAYQQQNTRFVYDLDKDMLSFAKEDCSKDVAIRHL